MNDTKLSEALERFADLLFRPLLSSKMLEKEIHAVDSEFQIGKQNDGHRITEIQRFTSRPDHPFSKFCWGNLQSLSSAGEEKLSLLVRKFHNQYYRKNNVRLVVYIPGTDEWNIERLQQVVLEKFAAETSKGKKEAYEVKYGNGYHEEKVDYLMPQMLNLPFHKDLSNNFFHIVPVTECYSMQITFQFPSLDRQFASMPMELIGELIGHEGEGSLFSLLKREGLAHSILAGAGREESNRNPVFWLFHITLDLSIRGMKFLSRVFELIFQYIRLIRETDQSHHYRVFQELKTISEYDFRFQEEHDPLDLVEEFALKMLNPHISSASLLTAMELFFDFDWNIVSGILDQMVPENCRVDILCPTNTEIHGLISEAQESPWLKDPWFGIKFRQLSIPQSWIECANFTPIHSKLMFLQPNNLLPQCLNLKKLDKPSPSIQLWYRNDDDSLRFWLKHDTKLSLPRANVFVRLSNPDISSSEIKASLSMMMFVQLASDYLNELCYTAHASGMYFEMSLLQYPVGLFFHFGGFSDRIFEFLKLIFEKMFLIFNDYRDLQRSFLNTKESMEIELRTREYKLSEYSDFLLRLSLVSQAHDIPSVLQQLEQLTMEDVFVCAQLFFERISLESFIHGNVNQEESELAVSSLKLLFRKLDAQGFSKSVPQSRLIELIPGKSIRLQVKGSNEKNNNSSITNHYQFFSDSIEARAKLKLLESLLAESFFDELRTEQQVGYVVSCARISMEFVVGLEFHIVSSKYDPIELDDRIEAFIQDYLGELEDMDADEFKEVVDGLISDIQSEDFSISDVGKRLWHEIIDRTFIFDRLEQEVEVLQKVTKQDMIQLYKSYVWDIEKRKKISVQVCSSDRFEDFMEKSLKSEADPLITLRSVTDAVEFRNGRSLYPVQLFTSNT